MARPSFNRSVRKTFRRATYTPLDLNYDKAIAFVMADRLSCRRHLL
jgi:hypothetical protein